MSSTMDTGINPRSEWALIEIIDEQAAEIERLEARLKILQDGAVLCTVYGKTPPVYEYKIYINTPERKTALFGDAY